METKEDGFLLRRWKDLKEYWPLYLMILFSLGIVVYVMDVANIINLF